MAVSLIQPRSHHVIFALETVSEAICKTTTSTTTTTTTAPTNTTTGSTNSTALPPQCFVAGECEGELIGILAGTAGVDDCLAACKNTSGCVWFTEYEVGELDVLDTKLGCWIGQDHSPAQSRLYHFNIQHNFPS